MIKTDVTEFICDSCGKSISMYHPGYGVYPNGWIKAGYTSTASFEEDSYDFSISFHGTIFCSRQCLCDYFKKCVAAAPEPKNEEQTEEAAA